MRKIIPLAVAALMAAASHRTYAQSHVKEELENFVSQISENNIGRSTEETNGADNYYGEYEFSVKKNGMKRFEAVKEAFYRDKADAYKVFGKEAGKEPRKSVTIGYSTNNCQNLRIGWPWNNKKDNILFLFFKGKDSDTYRTVYGMVWQEKGKGVSGKMYKVRSLNPNRADKTVADGKSPRVLVSKHSVISSGVGGTKVVTGPNGTIVTTDDGRVITSGTKANTTTTTTTATGSDGETYSVVTLNDNTVKIYKNGDVSVVDKHGREQKFPGVQASSSVDSDVDPIQKFSNMRAAYLENLREGNIGDTTLLTGLANSMLSFCKKRGSDMSADEKSLCVKGLKEMQEKTPDEYIQGIFSLAVNALGGK